MQRGKSAPGRSSGENHFPYIRSRSRNKCITMLRNKWRHPQTRPRHYADDLSLPHPASAPSPYLTRPSSLSPTSARYIYSLISHLLDIGLIWARTDKAREREREIEVRKGEREKKREKGRVISTILHRTRQGGARASERKYLNPSWRPPETAWVTRVIVPPPDVSIFLGRFSEPARPDSLRLILVSPRVYDLFSQRGRPKGRPSQKQQAQNMLSMYVVHIDF